MGYLLAYNPYNTNLFLNSSAPPPIVLDPDAAAFLTTAGITDYTISLAINNLVIGLKTDGIWAKCLAIYPFVGGTSITHKYNLRNLASYNLSFSGGWTHTSTGAKPNGINAFANTGLIPSVNLTTNYGSASYYSRNGDEEIATSGGTVIGVRSDNDSTVNNNFTLAVKIKTLNFSTFNFTVTGTTVNQQGRYLDTIGTGFYVGSMDGVRGDIYRNGIVQTTENFSYSRNTPNLGIYLGSLNNKGIAAEYTLKESAFAHIGDALTNTDISNLNNRVQAFQTTLGRQV